MARRETPIQHMIVKIVNIVLYPTKRQVKDIYVDMFRKIFEDKRTINTYGDRWTRIRSLYISDDENTIHGDFTNFYESNDKALNKITNEIIDIETDPTKGLSPKIWPYYFFPEQHRLVFNSDEGSESQIVRFLNESFGSYLDKDEYKINTEKDREVIDRILSSTSLTKLYMCISYSNNDNNKGWKGLIDQQLRKSKSRTAKMQFTGSKKEPIDIANSELISGAVELSASMGFVEAIESKQRGGSRKIKTIDHPMVRAIEYEDNPAPAMRRLVQSIANDDNITPE